MSIHLPALIHAELDIPRSRARALIDTGRVSLNGAVLSAGEHDITLLADSVLVVQPSEQVPEHVELRILQLEKFPAPREHDCEYGCCKAGEEGLASEVVSIAREVTNG